MSCPDSEWRLRPFQAGDETGLVQLFERGFGRPLDERSWRWKLKERHSPVENVWLAVDSADRPVFHYAGMPRALTLGGETRDVMVAVDSVTDPGYRRRGILTAGVEAAHREWAAAGVAGVLGLPNEQWGSRVGALGWQPLFPLKWLILPLRPERLLAGRSRLPALGRLALLGKAWRSLWRRRPGPALEIHELERAEDGFDALWQECAPEGQLMLARDREWLDWRYSHCPQHRYRLIAAERAGRLAGYAAYRFDPESGFGFIAELLTPPAGDGARRALVDAVAGRLADLGAVAVAALAIPGTVLYRELRRTGFVLSWGAFLVHWVPLSDDPPINVLRRSGRWYLHGGDFDVI